MIRPRTIIGQAATYIMLHAYQAKDHPHGQEEKEEEIPVLNPEPTLTLTTPDGCEPLSE